jgi:hypothetical protein
MLNPEEAVEVLNQFPKVDFAFAYGSGAVAQEGYDYKKKLAAELPMLDLILVVEDSLAWHKENMQRNPHHYTPLISLSASSVTFMQEHFQAHMWFNPYVPAAITSQPGRLMKYGVISFKQALEDLNTWNNLYLAGRLHKPVHILQSNPIFDKAMQSNRTFALQTALMLLPQRFSEVDLYLTIASLSYVGDPRMLIGENPKKVQNLVLPVVPMYQKLYAKEIENLLLQEFIPNPESNKDDMAETNVNNASSKNRWRDRFVGLRDRMKKPSSSSTSTASVDSHDQIFGPLLSHLVPTHPLFSSSGSNSYPGVFMQDIRPAVRWQRSLHLPTALKNLLSIRYFHTCLCELSYFLTVSMSSMYSFTHRVGRSDRGQSCACLARHQFARH